MTSKGTRSDATGRHMLHHPFETLEEHLSIHHERAEQSNQAKEDNGKSPHFANPAQEDGSVQSSAQAESAKESQQAPGEPQDTKTSHPSKSGVRDPDSSRAEDVARDFLGRSEEHRTVRDPITHQLLENVRDVTKEEYRGGLSEAAKVDEELRQPGRARDNEQNKPRWAGTSALPAFPYKMDPPDNAGLQNVIDRLRFKIAGVLCTLICSWAVGLSLWIDWLKVAVLASISLALVPFANHIICRRLHDSLSDLDAELEQERGHKIAQSHWPESAEWANKVLAEIWPAIQPEMFDSLRDTLEDLLQANVPSFLSEVKVADFTQGANPLRILSVSLLPNTEWKDESDGMKGDKDKAKDTNDPLRSEIRQAEQEAHKEANPEEEMVQEEHDPNDRYVNLSVTFAYRGRPHKSSRRQRYFQMAEDIQMLLLLVAKFGPAALMLPVKVHLQGLVGTVRIRTHLIASPPFLGQTVLSFTSLPRVSLDVVPLKVVSLNDIKPLAGFVQRSIDSAFAAITAPKSISIDLASLISSDGVQRQINAVGVVLITLLGVEGLERADVFGLSDPYALFLWNRSGKPMFSTRVILKELSPRFHESMAILVPQEIVKAKECIGVEIFDSDRGTDDFLGKTEMELSELLNRPGEVIRRTEQLTGVKPGSRRPGKATWSACFLPKARKVSASQTQQPQRSQDNVKREARGPEERAKEQPKQDQGQTTLISSPPSASLPSGILSIQIHEIAALSNKSSLNVPSSTSHWSLNTAEGRSLPDEDTTDDLADEAPSSYVEVIAEDKLVYRTRTKISDYRPIFNASTEKVILDWRSARVLLVVREKKFDEDDPILGIVPLTLAQVFEAASLSSGWHPISGGIGSGRIKISLLFQSVNLPDPCAQSFSAREAPICPSSIGVIRINTLKLTTHGDSSMLQNWSKHSLTLRTLSTRSRISSKYSKLLTSPEGEAHVLTYEDQLSKKPALIPTFRRGASPLMLRLDTKDSLGRTKIDTMAVFWLRNLRENEDTTIRIPIYKMHDKTATRWLRQQYADHHHFESMNDDEPVIPTSVNATIVGKAELELRFVPGVNSLHGRIKDPSGGLTTVCQAWKLAVRKGLVQESWPPPQHQSREERSETSSGGSPQEDYFYDANSSSSDEDSSDDERPAQSRRRRSQRENFAQSQALSVKNLAASSVDKVTSGASQRDGVSAGSKADLVRRFGRDLSDRQPIPLHYLDDNADTAEAQEAASGDVKAIRVLDSAIGAIKDRSQKFAYSFDRKKGQKGGEGVEAEV